MTDVLDRALADLPLQSTEVVVLPIAELRHARVLSRPARIIVDATGSRGPSRRQVAQIAVLRRRLRAGGGDLLLAAAPETADTLRKIGLHWSISCRPSLLAKLRDRSPAISA